MGKIPVLHVSIFKEEIGLIWGGGHFLNLNWFKLVSEIHELADPQEK